VEQLRLFFGALGKDKRERCSPPAAAQATKTGLLWLVFAAAHESESADRVLAGTASLYTRISKDVFVILTAAHNLAQEEERMGETVKKEAKSADFFL